MTKLRDHGGGVDHAVAQYGGAREEWLDLSTGINPNPYPIGDIPPEFWARLPDSNAQDALIQAARTFWNVPPDADILPSSGVSALIANIPNIFPQGGVKIATRTYNEHAAAFKNHGWDLDDNATAQVIVHPNNPDGTLYEPSVTEIENAPFIIIDESFCDTCPDKTHIKLASRPNVIILKGLGKFWGLAGLRLGFAIGHPDTIARLRNLIGPWAISGPAQYVGALALRDHHWAQETRRNLSATSLKLDKLANTHGMKTIGGTDLFRLYAVDDAKELQHRLAQNYIWIRRFPYSKKWVRLGFFSNDHQRLQLQNALGA